ncbi:MAG: tRNA pseudouridine(13) synthase TruD [Ignisphaera sp.]
MIKQFISKHFLDIALGIYTYTYPEANDMEIEVLIPRPYGFVVYEIVNGISLDVLDRDHGSIDECHNKYIYIAKKINIDTYTLCELLKKKLSCSSSEILGLKDTEAVAHQVVILYGCRAPVKELKLEMNERHVEAFLWQCDTEVIHNGNKFMIKLVIDPDNVDVIMNRLNVVKKYRGMFLNFFGYQRFGSRRPITHILGKFLVKKNWDSFIEVLCEHSFSTQYSAINGRGYTFCNLRYRYEDSLTFIKKAIPRHYLRLFVEAYQSYLFNVVLSKLWIEMLNNRSIENTVSIMNSIYRYIPIIGSRIKIHQPGIKNIIEEVLNVEGIEPKDFILKELGIESRGDFRESITYARDIYVYSERNEIRISFVLDRGSYASIFIREIIRSDPLLFT